MIACLDVQYETHLAAAAAVVFDEWSASTPTAQYSAVFGGSGEYEPGKFYLRELAPLLAVIQQIGEPIDALVIDAYCYLSEDKLPGLGMHLHAAINQHCSIIGVAKNRYQDSRHAEELLRGGSARPLFVTALGMPQPNASANIAAMAGDFRIPTLIKAADQLARQRIIAELDKTSSPSAEIGDGK